MDTDASAPTTLSQFLRFVAVGLVNTAFGYGVFAAMVIAGTPPMPALVAAYVAGILFNFVTTRKFVFGRSESSSFLRFVAAYGVIYIFNAVLYEVFAATGAPPLVSQAICLPIVAVFSFILFKLHVFKDTHSSRPPGGATRG